jgi:hypothetical protein
MEALASPMATSSRSDRRRALANLSANMVKKIVLKTARQSKNVCMVCLVGENYIVANLRHSTGIP